MQTISANTAGQTLRLTLIEGAQWLVGTYTKYLLILTNDKTGEDFALIPVVASETDRITTLTIGTNVDNAVNGSIQITTPGVYLYTVYAQNSNTNLDPADAVVVEDSDGNKGVVEQGWILIAGTQDYITDTDITIPDVIEI